MRAFAFLGIAAGPSPKAAYQLQRGQVADVSVRVGLVVGSDHNVLNRVDTGWIAYAYGDSPPPVNLFTIAIATGITSKVSTLMPSSN